MLSLKLAWRNLFRNTRRTILTCTLIASALIVLILVDGIMLGMVKVMVGGITHTLEGEAQVNRKGFRENLSLASSSIIQQKSNLPSPAMNTLLGLLRGSSSEA